MMIKTDTRLSRAAEVDKRMARSSATGNARAVERRRVETEVEAEEVAAQKSASDHAEATAERGRIAAVVRLGRDRDRGRQALRAALLTPIGVEAATGLIAALPADAAASPEAVTVPGFVAFGSEAAQSERRRITSAFARPEAAGRFGAVCALALEGDAGLTGAQIAPLLATMPTEASRARTPGPGERAAGLAEFGGEAAPIRSKADAVHAGWAKAVAAANASIGAVPAMPATPTGGPVSIDQLDPLFGHTAEGRAAAEAALRAQAG